MRRLLIPIILCIGVSSAAAEFDPSLQGVRFFAYQLQNFDTPEGLQALRDSHYDLLVIDQTRSIKGSEDYDSAADVASLHATTGSSVNPKKVVCYLDAGQAEDFRWYWQDGWSVGNPAWILASDPDWPGDYPVKFWDLAWKDLMKQNLAMIVADGYDGAYLDWMEIYSFGPLVQAAQAEGKDPREELIDFIRELRDYARSLNPNFFFIAQNAAELGACREWLDLFSGIGQEDVWFTWGDGQPGDVPQDPDLTAAILADLAIWKAAGKVVFDIEYAQEPANTSAAYASGKAQGFITYATLKELDRISDTPPTDYRVYNITADRSVGGVGPSFSPDGQEVLFTTYQNHTTYLGLMKPDGSEFKPVIADDRYHFGNYIGRAWNGSGDKFCFSSDKSGANDVWVADADGTGLIQVTQNAGSNHECSFSPDGQWVAYYSDRTGKKRIYKQNIETGEVVQLTNEDGDYSYYSPNWSPDGHFIVYRRGFHWESDICIMDEFGINSDCVVNSVNVDVDPSFTPDGKWILFSSNRDRHNYGDLYLMSVDDTRKVFRLTNFQVDSGYSGDSPSISPDGKLIAFHSTFGWSGDIWTMPIYLPPPSPHERPISKPD